MTNYACWRFSPPEKREPGGVEVQKPPLYVHKSQFFQAPTVCSSDFPAFRSLICCRFSHAYDELVALVLSLRVSKTPDSGMLPTCFLCTCFLNLIKNDMDLDETRGRLFLPKFGIYWYPNFLFSILFTDWIGNTTTSEYATDFVQLYLNPIR